MLMVLRCNQRRDGLDARGRSRQLHSYATYVFGWISRTLRIPEGSRSTTCVFGRIDECIARPARGCVRTTRPRSGAAVSCACLAAIAAFTGMGMVATTPTRKRLRCCGAVAVRLGWCVPVPGLWRRRHPPTGLLQPPQSLLYAHRGYLTTLLRSRHIQFRLCYLSTHNTASSTSRAATFPSRIQPWDQASLGHNPGRGGCSCSTLKVAI